MVSLRQNKCQSNAGFFNSPTTQRCQSVFGNTSAAASTSPLQASEMISRTPLRPRSFR
jgi:hypothetical protein